MTTDDGEQSATTDETYCLAAASKTATQRPRQAPPPLPPGCRRGGRRGRAAKPLKARQPATKPATPAAPGLPLAAGGTAASSPGAPSGARRSQPAQPAHASFLRNIFDFLGYPQGPTPIWTDNAVAASFAEATCKLTKSKSIDLRWYWIQDRVKQGQFVVKWVKGAANPADYFTKPQPVEAHTKWIRTFVHIPEGTGYKQASKRNRSRKGNAQRARGG